MLHKRFDIAVILAVALIVAACSDGGAASSAPASAPPSAPASVEPSMAPSGDGEADLVIWADALRTAALQPLADEFGAANGVTVVVEEIAENLVPTFLTATQAGEAPDIIIAAHDHVGNLVANSAIDPIQLSDTSGFDPLAIQGMTFDGQLYGIPYSVENIALFRNPELVPDAPATMEDLIAAGEALVEAGDAENIMALQVGQTGDPYHIYPLFSSGGGALFGLTPEGDPDPENVAVDSAGSIAAGELIQSIGETGSGALSTSIDGTNAIPLFFDGKAPFLVSGPWATGQIVEAGAPYDISPIPAWADGDPAGPFIGVNGFYLASGGQNKALAQEFATNFITTEEVQVALYEAEPRRPALIAAVEAVKADDPDIEKFQAASEGGTILPAIPEMGQVWTPFGIAEAAIVKGEDVTTSLQAAAQAIRDGIAGS